jgi:hypothetical protein
MKPQLRVNKLLYLAGVFLLAGVGLAAIVLVMPAAAAVQNANATVWLDGPSGEIVVGDEITVTVRISDVVDLYGVEMTINFTPTDLQVIDADGVKPGIQIAAGECPQPDLTVRNVVSNTAGTVEYVVSQWNPTPPFSGDCSVAHIHFETKREALTAVRFVTLILSSKEPAEIPSDPVDLMLEIKAAEGDTYMYIPLATKN